MFTSRSYLRLSILFAILAIAAYLGVLAIPPVKDGDSKAYNDILNGLYYNGSCVYRLLFCISATYLTFYTARWDRRTSQIIALKYLFVYLCGFQLVRLIFNMFIGNAMCNLELVIDGAGLIVTSYLLYKSLRNDVRHWNAN